MRLILPVLVAATALLSPLAAYSPTPVPQEEAVVEIQEIEIRGADDHREQILDFLNIKVGDAYDPERANAWLISLPKYKSITIKDIFIEPLNETSVKLILVVEVPDAIWNRLIFEGLEHLSRQDLMDTSHLQVGQSLNRSRLDSLILAWENQYKQLGFAHVSITVQSTMNPGEVLLVVDEGEEVDIGRINFVGNTRFPGSNLIGLDLIGEMESDTGWFFWATTTYNPEALLGDITAIKVLYQEYGYFDAEVSIDEPVYYDNGEKVQITFRIEEGLPYVVDSIRFESVSGESLTIPQDELTALLRMKPGMVYQKAYAQADLMALRALYGAKGHPVASFGAADAEGFLQINPSHFDSMPAIFNDPETHLSTVVWQIREGTPKKIRNVLITGNHNTRDPVIRREIYLEPGDSARTDEADRSKRRLLGQGYYFDPETGTPFVDYGFLAVPQQPDWVDLEFRVKEGPGTGNFQFGGGLGSLGSMLMIQYKKSNFDITRPPSSLGASFIEIFDGRAFTGGGQQFSINAMPGTEYSRYSMNFHEPDLFGDHVEQIGFGVNFNKSNLRLRTHLEERAAASVRFSRHLSREWSLWASPGYEVVGMNEFSAGAPDVMLNDEGDHTLHRFSIGSSFNSVLNPFSPIEGIRLNGNLTQGGGPLGGDWDYLKGTASFSKYFPLFEDGLGRRWVFSAKASVGRAWPQGDSDTIPYTQRFFLGGQSTLRGFYVRGAGTSVNSFPLGGEAMWRSTTELSLPFASTLKRGVSGEYEWARLAFFLDAGQLGESFSDLDPMRAAVGVSFRIRIPFMPQMPLVLDFGKPILSEEGDRERLFTFTFGSMF